MSGESDKSRKHCALPFEDKSHERYIFDFDGVTYPTESDSSLERALWDVAEPLERSSPERASDAMRKLAYEAREEILYLKVRLREATRRLRLLAQEIDDDS